MNASLLDKALELAETYPVFPCKPDKRPACQHGFKDASQDPEVVQRLFSLPGAALIGVPTGERTGLVVIDCDNGAATRHWQETGLAQTRTHNTRRGIHYLYRNDFDLPIKSGVNLEGVDGLDVRAEGGYVIWWWAEGLGGVDDEPEYIEHAKVPKKIKPNGYAEQRQGSAFQFNLPRVGQRTDWLIAAIGGMAGTPEFMNDKIRELNLSLPDPLSDAELRLTVIPAIARFHGKQTVVQSDYDSFTLDE